jgi:hypothetical protein
MNAERKGGRNSVSAARNPRTTPQKQSRAPLLVPQQIETDVELDRIVGDLETLH